MVEKFREGMEGWGSDFSLSKNSLIEAYGPRHSVHFAKLESVGFIDDKNPNQ